MATVSDVVFTVHGYDWAEFAENNMDNPYVKSAKVTSYARTDLVNVMFEGVKWYTKDEYIDAIYIFFEDKDYLFTSLDEDNSINQTDHVHSDDDISEFWDYAPQVKLIV